MKEEEIPEWIKLLLPDGWIYDKRIEGVRYPEDKELNIVKSSLREAFWLRKGNGECNWKFDTIEQATIAAKQLHDLMENYIGPQDPRVIAAAEFLSNQASRNEKYSRPFGEKDWRVTISGISNVSVFLASPTRIVKNAIQAGWKS